MELAIFLITVILVSLSGVMAPGPLFAATLAEGRKNIFAGFVISSGHAVIEIPLILALYIFGLTIPDNSRAYISMAGGIVMLYLAYMELRGEKSESKAGKALFTGITMSALNPYFIMWWLTIGLTLILKSVAFGLIGIVLFIIAHESCDFLWLGFISVSSSKATALWGNKAKKILTAVSTAILIIFGLYFIYTGTAELVA